MTRKHLTGTDRANMDAMRLEFTSSGLNDYEFADYCNASSGKFGVHITHSHVCAMRMRFEIPSHRDAQGALRTAAETARREAEFKEAERKRVARVEARAAALKAGVMAAAAPPGLKAMTASQILSLQAPPTPERMALLEAFVMSVQQQLLELQATQAQMQEVLTRPTHASH